jgi:hypothetical protein
MKKQTYRCEDEKYKKLQKKLIDDEISFQGFVDWCVGQYLKGQINPKEDDKMLNINKESLKNGIEGIWFHLRADGRSKEEYRIYYNFRTERLEIHSSIGSNWYPGNNNELIHVAKVSQNVDIESWFDLPRLRDDEGNNLGVWWDDNPEGDPFTEDDFFTEVFEEYIRELFSNLDNLQYYDPEKDEEVKVKISDDEYNKLDDVIDEILDELREELNLDDEKPLLQG